MLSGGDPLAGKVAFQELGCCGCHRVAGEVLPIPTVDPPVPVVLGSSLDRKSRAYLAESIIHPDYRLARPRPVIASDPPVLPPRRYENITVDGHSRMRDYAHRLTVKQWLDLVAYLEQVQSSPPAIPST